MAFTWDALTKMTEDCLVGAGEPRLPDAELQPARGGTSYVSPNPVPRVTLRCLAERCRSASSKRSELSQVCFHELGSAHRRGVFAPANAVKQALVERKRGDPLPDRIGLAALALSAHPGDAVDGWLQERTGEAAIGAFGGGAIFSEAEKGYSV